MITINKWDYIILNELTEGQIKKFQELCKSNGYHIDEDLSQLSSCMWYCGIVNENGTFTYEDYDDEDLAQMDSTDHTEYLKQLPFTKSDLKDGMVVTYRDNSKAMLFGNNFYNFEDKDCPTLNFELDLSVYPNETLSCKLSRMLDIIKVEYDGKILWEDQDHIEKEARYRQIMEVFNKEGLKGVKSLLESFL